ncbi:MAG: helix-turn-helix transcriptional regulator [Hymenobacter sp.]|nr:helix-turn-helix transcriptional regulator [Hymenobacter sp.]
MQSRNLFQSDFCEIKRWAINLTQQEGGSKGYNDCFCLVFVHSGRFAVELATQPYELYTGHVVVEKADYAYKLRPSTGVCSIFNFSASFYEQFIEEYGLRHSSFFVNPNLLTLSLTTSPAIDYLHHQIVHNLGQVGKLEVDCLVVKLVRLVVERVENRPLAELATPMVKSFHLETIEQAKMYLNSQFNQDISLVDLASHCCVSPFHLSRLFKECTGYSPHQYLVAVRLTHAEQLLRQPTLTVADVCYASGFNSPEHFAAAFQQKNHLSPTQYRKQ